MIKNSWKDEELLCLYESRRDGLDFDEIVEILLDEYGADRTVVAARLKYYRTDWDEFLDECEIDIDDTSDNEEQIDFAIANKGAAIKASHDKRMYNDLLKRSAEVDLWQQKVLGSIVALPPIDVGKIIVPQTQRTREEQGGLILSDLHIGNCVSPEEIGYPNAYNVDVFKARLYTLIDSVIKITDNHRTAYPIKTLNVFLLGDIVHGMNEVGKWSSVNIDQDVMDQVFIAMHELTKALVMLAKTFENVNVHCIYGNHGRTAKMGVQKNYSNWDYMCYKFLEQHFIANDRVNFNITKASYNIVNVTGQKFLITHGEGIRGFHGIPFYGIMRAQQKYHGLIESSKKNDTYKQLMLEAIDKLISDSGTGTNGVDKSKLRKDLLSFVLEESKTFDYWLLGHFHTSGELEANNSNIIMNSSFIGPDDYSINSLRSCSKPSQIYFGIHPEGISWRYNIDLDR